MWENNLNNLWFISANAWEICFCVFCFEYPVQRQSNAFASSILRINELYTGSFSSFDFNRFKISVLLDVFRLIKLSMLCLKSFFGWFIFGLI